MEARSDIFVYLGDPADSEELARHKKAGGKWVAHFLGYNGGEATSWTRHASELDPSEVLTESDIVSATATAVRQRLSIDDPRVEYLMLSVGTQSGMRLSPLTDDR